jgi:tetratricopeptide (TPR) repeat protein
VPGFASPADLDKLACPPEDNGGCILLANLLLLPPLALAESNTDWDDCASDDADRIIAACDRIIAEGNERKVNFAIAHYNRGVGYQKKGDHAKAIADFTRSIKINAADPRRFARDSSYADLGEYDLAIADRDHQAPALFRGHPLRSRLGQRAGARQRDVFTLTAGSQVMLRDAAPWDA